VHSQQPKVPGLLRIQPIKASVYMVSGEGGNVAFDVTTEGVVIVDDMFDRNHADILKQVQSVTSQPLRYVINTHQHDDHAGGDLKMLPLAEVIAHKNVRANLLHIKQPYYEDTPGTPIGLPRVTFSDELDIALGSRDIRAIHFGRGHTNGDTVVYFPDLKVIHTGDLFLGRQVVISDAVRRHPAANVYIDYAQGGSLLEWGSTLDHVLALDFETVIPGHGGVATRADVVRFRDDIGTMQAELLDDVKRGVTKDQLLNVLSREYGWKVAGCPLSPPTAGCLQFQQVDALIAELRKSADLSERQAMKRSPTHLTVTNDIR
jgi:glyoxylase-like metal-dependent hydrolase (beta-lactamase superfamily II)